MRTEILTEADLKLLRDALGDSPGARLMVELASLRSEVAELRPAAERYRWLRSRATLAWSEVGVEAVSSKCLANDSAWSERRDAAIDAVMQRQACNSPA